MFGVLGRAGASFFLLPCITCFFLKPQEEDTMSQTRARPPSLHKPPPADPRRTHQAIAARTAAALLTSTSSVSSLVFRPGKFSSSFSPVYVLVAADWAWHESLVDPMLLRVYLLRSGRFWCYLMLCQRDFVHDLELSLEALGCRNEIQIADCCIIDFS
jgi:hypothetical protein